MRLQFIFLFTVVLACIVGGVVHFRSTPGDVLPGPVPPAAKQIAVPVTAKIVPSDNHEFVSADELLRQATNVVASAPELALAIGWQLLAADPADENGRAATILNALCNAGQFQTALAFASETPTDAHSDWLKLVFARWAQNQPQDAVKSLDTIADPQQHSTAFRALVDGWNSGSPSGLAAYAFALPSGEDRDYALGAALDNWSLQDPAGLATWLNTLPPGVECDVGAAMMIAKSDGANYTPELAMQWVENINDPEIKQDSLLHVLDEWSQTDSAAARQYVATVTWLADSQRQEILGKITAAR
jgi:hypothetical protein